MNVCTIDNTQYVNEILIALQTPESGQRGTDKVHIYYGIDSVVPIDLRKDSIVARNDVEIESSNDVTTAKFVAPLGFNPPYSLSLTFEKNSLVTLSVMVAPIDPNMAQPRLVPFELGLPGTKLERFRLPISYAEMIGALGAPDSEQRLLKWP